MKFVFFCGTNFRGYTQVPLPKVHCLSQGFFSFISIRKLIFAGTNFCGRKKNIEKVLSRGLPQISFVFQGIFQIFSKKLPKIVFRRFKFSLICRKTVKCAKIKLKITMVYCMTCIFKFFTLSFGTKCVIPKSAHLATVLSV